MSKTLAWLSDLHADIFGRSLVPYYKKLKRRRFNGVVITGDISNGVRLEEDLMELSVAFDCPIYFTLGNHDFYGGSIQGVKQLVRQVCAKTANLIHLDQNSPIWLSKRTALIGCLGWGDGQAGYGKDSGLALNDRAHISDFYGKTNDEYFDLLHQLGRASAIAFFNAVQPTLDIADHVILATHVPPYVKSCVFRDRENYLPYYVNVTLGRAILKVAREYPQKHFSVYCGHTHRSSVYHPLPNVSVNVALAHYEVFALAGMIPIKKPTPPEPKFRAVYSFYARDRFGLGDPLPE